MFNTRIKDIREDNDITQEELGKILKVSRSTIAGWENDIDSIPFKKLESFCSFFDVSLDYVLRLSKDNNPSYNRNTDFKLLGKRLKKIRCENNDSQVDVSKKLNISQTYCSKLENGNSIILTNVLKQFCLVYNISADWLCGKTD